MPAKEVVLLIVPLDKITFFNSIFINALDENPPVTVRPSQRVGLLKLTSIAVELSKPD